MLSTAGYNVLPSISRLRNSKGGEFTDFEKQRQKIMKRCRAMSMLP